MKTFGHSLMSVAALLFAVTAVGVVGCSPSIPQGTLKGNVTLNGEPYEDAAIMFLDLDSGQAAGVDIDAGGSFTIPEPMHTGTYKAYLAPRSLPPEENGEPIPVSADASVPQKYWNENTTDIEVEVKEGENSTTIAFEK